MLDYSKGIPERTAGLDLGDKRSYAVVLDAEGEVVQSCSLKTGRGSFERLFSGGLCAGMATPIRLPSAYPPSLKIRAGHQVGLAELVAAAP